MEEFGTVVIGPKFVNEEDVFLPLKPVMRIATDEDIEKHRKIRLMKLRL